MAKFLGDLTGIATMVVGVWLVSRNDPHDRGPVRVPNHWRSRHGPLVQLVQTWQQFKIQSRNLTLAADVVDRPTEQSEREAENIPMPPLTGEVAIEKVDFRYQEQGAMTLHNVSLNVPAGTFVGLVGGSGSGKSTLLKPRPPLLRPRIWPHQNRWAGHQQGGAHSLRRQIGVCPRLPCLTAPSRKTC